MPIRFIPVSFAVAAPVIAAHLESLVGWIDSYQEEHIRDSTHYQIELDGQVVGSTSILDTNLITSFIIEPAYRQHGQESFAAIRKLENVTSAFVSTIDGYYLANAIDNVHEIKRQAYAFALAPDRIRPSTEGYQLRPATSEDVPTIREHSAEFFEPHLTNVDTPDNFTRIYVATRQGEAVAYGISDRSRLYRATASIGMFVIENQRMGGVGTAMIGLLIDEILKQGLNVAAGCWYYNHPSKRTLERAGLHATSRLLRIEY